MEREPRSLVKEIVQWNGSLVHRRGYKQMPENTRIPILSELR